MSIQNTRSLKALVLFAILSGVLVAVLRNTEFDRKLEQFIPGITRQAESETNTASGPSNPDESSNPSPVQLEGLPDENNGKDETGNTVTPTGQDESGPDETDTIDADKRSEEQEQEQEQGSNDEELVLELSKYGPTVRKRLSRARDFYNRARKQNELVQDPSISPERRREANSKARTNAQRSLDLLQAVKDNLNNRDPDVNTMMDRVKKIYRKSFRRAKMWGGF